MGYPTRVEERHTALRGDVRDSARSFRLLRRFGICVSACLVVAAVGRHLTRHEPLVLLGFAVSLAIAGLFTMGWLFRRLIRGSLEMRLARLPADQQVAVLLPLRDDGNPETRRVAESLIKQYCELPSEVAPSVPAEGRGSEPAVTSEPGAPRGTGSR